MVVRVMKHTLDEDVSCPKTLIEAVSMVFVYLAFAGIECLQWQR
jgi:hypothetical protein